MKNLNYLLLMSVLVFASCTKDTSIKNDLVVSNLETREKKLTADQLLFRQWTEWSMRIDPSMDPGSDFDGSLALQNQPYIPGTLFLIGAYTDAPIERTITVSLSQYQKIFFPFISIWWWHFACEPLTNNENPKAKPGLSNFQSFFNGKNHELDFKWDGIPFAPTGAKPLYLNGGIWQTEVHPGFYGYCNLVQPVDLHIEGMVIQLPLTLGDHTLECKGFISSGKYHQFSFSSNIKYIIHVIP